MEQGPGSPEHLIFRLRQRSQAICTEFLRDRLLMAEACGDGCGEGEPPSLAMAGVGLAPVVFVADECGD